MSSRSTAFDVGADTARAVVADLCREIRRARQDRGVSQDALGRAVGMSGTWVSRIERGLVADLSIRHASLLLSAVGQRLAARAYPAGSPIRDAAHTALLDRLRHRIHRSLCWALEVPLSLPGDLRAWDPTITGVGWRIGVEAETRPRDWQALTRRIALKQRDGDVDATLLVLPDSRHNRDLVRSEADALAEQFPVPGRRALELLGAGAAPGGNAIVLL
jgi:transcriptional regulator with XRE-family HTH domain